MGFGMLTTTPLLGLPYIFYLFGLSYSIHDDKDNHRRDIEQDQQGQKETDPPILKPIALELFHYDFAHNGTRSSAITSKSAGK
jgi:hypothetical protein